MAENVSDMSDAYKADRLSKLGILAQKDGFELLSKEWLGSSENHQLRRMSDGLLYECKPRQIWLLGIPKKFRDASLPQVDLVERFNTVSFPMQRKQKSFDESELKKGVSGLGKPDFSKIKVPSYVGFNDLFFFYEEKQITERDRLIFNSYLCGEKISVTSRRLGLNRSNTNLKIKAIARKFEKHCSTFGCHLAFELSSFE